MHTLYFILLLLGAACFAAATIGRGALAAGQASTRAIALLPLGLLFWILVPLIQMARTLD